MQMLNDYWITDAEHGLGKAMVLKTRWRKEYLKVIRHHKIAILRLNERVGWSGDDLAFLADIPGLIGIDILSDKVRNLGPLLNLKELASISLVCKANTAVDFTAFKNLKYIFLDWRKCYDSVFQYDGLVRINIIRFPDKNLQRWKRNSNLRDLILSSNLLESLVGLESFPNVQMLKLHSCRKLASLDAIASTGELMTVRFEKCPRIGRLAFVATLARLKELEIEDCGNIQSLAPLTTCKNLERLQVAGNTNIIDGDFRRLQDLAKLKDVLLVARPHYSHLAEQLEH
jgi:Leucine-rich repeat (LRR) protein